MKKRIDVVASEESYTNLVTFNDIEKMNETVRAYRDIIKASVRRSDVRARLIDLLEILKRHSCKFIGVSFMRKNTIASLLNVSYKTVQRLVKKLVDFGMIRQVATKRSSDMLQTANAIIIQPVEKDEMSDKTPANSPIKCPTIKTKSISLKQKINNKRNIALSIENANFIAHWVPERFANLVNCFYTEAKTIQEFWKVIKQCNRIVDYETGKRAFNKNQELIIGIKAIKELVMKVKKGVRINNIFGYFNGIVDNIMNDLYFDHDFMCE